MDVRLNNQRFAAVPLGDQFSDFHRRAFAQVINIRFKRQTKAGDFQFTGAFIGSRQTISHRRFHLIDNPERFVIVHFARGTDKPRLLRVLCHNKPRINSDAVAAHARARLKNIDARVTIRQANQFPDVNPLIGTNQRQFISKSDIHIAEAVFGELTHFRRPRVSDDTLTFEENLVQFAGAGRANRRHAANHAIVFNQLDHYLSRQHAFRAVGNIDVSLLAHLLWESEIWTHLC